MTRNCQTQFHFSFSACLSVDLQFSSTAFPRQMPRIPQWQFSSSPPFPIPIATPRTQTHAHKIKSKRHPWGKFKWLPQWVAWLLLQYFAFIVLNRRMLPHHLWQSKLDLYPHLHQNLNLNLKDADEHEATAVGTRNTACCWLADFGYSSQTNELIITHAHTPATRVSGRMERCTEKDFFGFKKRIFRVPSTHLKVYKSQTYYLWNGCYREDCYTYNVKR